MTSKNKTCVVCGEKYSYCYNCNTKDPSWMALFHDENCKKIFDTVNKLYFNHITEAEALDILRECNVNVIDSVGANEKIKNTVKKLSATKKRKNTKKAVVEESTDTVEVEVAEESE